MQKIIYGPDDKIPGESGHDRCAYKGCKNGKYRMGGRKLFLFPSHTEPARREQWIKNCGNETLRKKSDSSIRRSGLCSDHFHPSSFTCGKKYTLKRNSIPLPNHPPHLAIGFKPYYENNNKQSLPPPPKPIVRRVPRLFEDEDDYDPDSLEMITEELPVNNIEDKIRSESLALFSDNEEDDSFTISEKIQPSNEINSTIPQNTNDTNDNTQTPIPSTAKNSNTPITTTISTKMSTVEILRRLNDDMNKEKKIKKLTEQNVSLRKELRRLKQNIRRWEQRKQQESTASKRRQSLKKQKRVVMNMINAMDISPFAKAVISLQLHTRKSPYTEEEKNLARAFQQYSRADLTRLRTVGCSFPSRSSIQRWLADLDKTQPTCDPLEISPKK